MAKNPRPGRSPKEIAREVDALLETTNPFLVKKAIDLSADERTVLSALDKAGGELSFAELERRLRISNDRVMKAADDLAARELASLWGHEIRLEPGAAKRVSLAKEIARRLG